LITLATGLAKKPGAGTLPFFAQDKNEFSDSGIVKIYLQFFIGTSIRIQ
jgi:hypothetical protein